jgi:hypothetical protein
MYLPGVQPPPPPTVDPATPVSILDDPDKDVTWQDNHLTREALRIIWHQRLGHMQKYAIGVPSMPNATETDNCCQAS